jgi:hypothetical protein
MRRYSKKIELAILENITVSQSAKSVTPFTQKQVINRANQWNLDYKKGLFKLQAELEEDSNNW